MIENIRRLEQIARRLAPDAQQRTALAQQALAYCEHFLQAPSQTPTFQPPLQGAGLEDSPITETGQDMESLLDLFDRLVVQPGINTTSSRLFGYIPGGGLYPAAVGDFLAAVTNRYVGVYHSAPGGVQMENQLLDWMAHMVGYPADSAGNLTSGGSTAHLIAIVTAREAFGLKGRDYERAVVYFSEQTHHSVAKALHIIGMGECQQRRIPLDERYHMQAQALDQAVQRDRQAGLLPWLVVASAGTTDSGAVDPLPAISQIAADNGLWLHVDGAYGAFFALCEPGRKRLAGMQASDSIIMDPHKGLFLPYGTGAVLVRRRTQLLAAFQERADYMQDVIEAPEQVSPADVSPELSKHFRGPRLWLPLKLFGTQPFAAALEEKLLLAQHFYERLQGLPEFVLGPAPDLSIVTFRGRPERGDPEAYNRQLIQALQQRGRVFLSSTRIQGQFTLRMAILSYHSHLEDVELAIDELQEISQELRTSA